MSATGLEVFDRTLQTTNIWLKEISAEIGPDRQTAWAVLGAVLRTLRDRLPVPLAAHLSAELPLLIRGSFYDRYQPARQPSQINKAEEFMEAVNAGLDGQRPIDTDQAIRAVFHVLGKHIPPGEYEKVCSALPESIRRLCAGESASVH